MTLAAYALADSPLADTPLDVGVADYLAAADSVPHPTMGYLVARADALVLVVTTDGVVVHGVLVVDALMLVAAASAHGLMAALEIEALTLADAQAAAFLWFAVMPETLQAQDASADNMVKGAWQNSDEAGNLWGLDTTPGRP